MKKLIILLLITNFFILTSYSQNKETIEKELKTEFKELTKFYNKRQKVVNKIVKIANQKNGNIKTVTAEKFKFTKNSKTNSLNILSYLESQSELTKPIIKSLLLIEQYPELKSTKKYIKYMDSLEKIENRISEISKKYNNLIDKNSSLTKYPRIGGKKENESDIEINFD